MVIQSAAHSFVIPWLNADSQLWAALSFAKAAAE